MSTRWIPARVGVKGLDGASERSGRRATCSACEGGMFALFQVGGHNDLFLQCLNCGRVGRLDESRRSPDLIFEPLATTEADTVHPFADQEGG